ncbi:MAG: hypothetical protein QM754_03000 [Tepidisphaeraceae bacterium]
MIAASGWPSPFVLMVGGFIAFCLIMSVVNRRLKKTDRATTARNTSQRMSAGCVIAFGSLFVIVGCADVLHDASPDLSKLQSRALADDEGRSPHQPARRQAGE